MHSSREAQSQVPSSNLSPPEPIYLPLCLWRPLTSWAHCTCHTPGPDLGRRNSHLCIFCNSCSPILSYPLLSDIWTVFWLHLNFGLITLKTSPQIRWPVQSHLLVGKGMPYAIAIYCLHLKIAYGIKTSVIITLQMRKVIAPKIYLFIQSLLRITPCLLKRICRSPNLQDLRMWTYK